MTQIEKKDLLSLSKSELEELIISIGEPKYRAKQIFSRLYKGFSPDEMTTLSSETKRKINEVSFY